MDNTFYEENQENNIKMLKNKMTLDFNSPTSHSKKSKLMKTCILESPDLKMCKLGSPELERMIIQHGMVTTTPTPSAVLPYFLKQEEQGVTEEQQEYARGFVDALNQLHRTNGHQQPNGAQQQHPDLPPPPPPQPQQPSQQQLIHNSQLNNINNSNHNNINSNSNSQLNGHQNHANSHLNGNHLNSNQNHMNTNNNNLNNCSNNNNNSHSSDSSGDMTIADDPTGASVRGQQQRRNSYHMLVPAQPPSQQVVVTTAAQIAVTTAGTTCYGNNSQTMNGKFVVPQLPPAGHDPSQQHHHQQQQQHHQQQQQQQYVQVSTAGHTGAHVLINNSVNQTAITTTASGGPALPPYSQAVSNNSIYPMTIKSESSVHSGPNVGGRASMSPPLSPPSTSNSLTRPIDMADQERIKLERKRLRNRIAASKCRRRKLERISRLEDKVKGLKGENSELSIVVNKLRDQVCGLKQQVMGHIKCGCHLMMPQ